MTEGSYATPAFREATLSGEPFERGDAFEAEAYDPGRDADMPPLEEPEDLHAEPWP